MAVTPPAPDRPDPVPDATEHRSGDGAASDGIDGDGTALVQAAWIGTGVFAVSAIAGVAVDALMLVSVPIALLLFLGGTVAFVSAFLQAVQRSREDAISTADLFFLTECAPKTVRRSFLLALAVLTTVAVATAMAKLYSPLAFGIMAPMWPLGLAGLWGARHGTFPSRDEPTPGPPAEKPAARKGDGSTDAK